MPMAHFTFSTGGLAAALAARSWRKLIVFQMSVSLIFLPQGSMTSNGLMPPLTVLKISASLPPYFHSASIRLAGFEPAAP